MRRLAANLRITDFAKPHCAPSPQERLMDRPVAVRTYLDFEKPVAELESKIADLRAIDSDDDAVSITEEVSRLQQRRTRR